MTREIVAFAAAFFAGAVNSVAGGGTLITFPALIWLGLPPITANATSTVSIWPGSLGAMWGYREELRTVETRLFALALPSVVGGLAGAALLRLTPAPVFDRLVPVLIVFATLLFMAQETIQRRFGHAAHTRHRGWWLVAAMMFQLLVGGYGGYFGGGIGILMLAALSIYGLTDIHQMNGLKNFLALCINGTAAIYFIWMGMVSWTEVLVMTTGAIVGGVWGAGMARRASPRAVRWVVVGIGLAMALSLALRR